jgi:hypothetical protein
LLVCQHVNFDVLVGLFALVGALTLAAYRRSRDALLWLAASLAFGLAALAKTAPLVVAPLLADGAKRNGRVAQLLALALFFGPILLGLAVIFALAPHAVTENVLLYRSARGYFCVTGLLRLAGAQGAERLYTSVGFPLMLSAWFIFGTRALIRRNSEAPGLILLVASTLLAIPTIGPGYGPQYAYWWMPVLLCTYPLFDREWRVVLALFFAIAVTTYVIEYAFFASQGAYLESVLPGSHFVAHAVSGFTSARWQTLARLPLFLSSLIVLSAAAQRLLGPEPADGAGREFVDVSRE